MPNDSEEPKTVIDITIKRIEGKIDKLIAARLILEHRKEEMEKEKEKEEK